MVRCIDSTCMSCGIFDVLGPWGKLSIKMKLAFTEEGK